MLGVRVLVCWVRNPVGVDVFLPFLPRVASDFRFASVWAHPGLCYEIPLGLGRIPLIRDEIKDPSAGFECWVLGLLGVGLDARGQRALSGQPSSFAIG